MCLAEAPLRVTGGDVLEARNEALELFAARPAAHSKPPAQRRDNLVEVLVGKSDAMVTERHGSLWYHRPRETASGDSRDRLDLLANQTPLRRRRCFTFGLRTRYDVTPGTFGGVTP